MPRIRPLFVQGESRPGARYTLPLDYRTFCHDVDAQHAERNAVAQHDLYRSTGDTAFRERASQYAADMRRHRLAADRLNRAPYRLSP